jgi:hypothetical protein
VAKEWKQQYGFQIVSLSVIRYAKSRINCYFCCSRLKKKSRKKVKNMKVLCPKWDDLRSLGNANYWNTDYWHTDSPGKHILFAFHYYFCFSDALISVRLLVTVFFALLLRVAHLRREERKTAHVQSSFRWCSNSVDRLSHNNSVCNKGFQNASKLTCCTIYD